MTLDPSPDATSPVGRRRSSSRARTAVISVLAVFGLGIVAALLPVPFIVVSPGPTFNTIGEVRGTPLVTVTGTTTYPTDGHLDMTTVRESGEPRSRITVFEALGAWVSRERAVLPRELLYPDDVTGDEVRQRNATLFSTSQSHAIAAALTTLDLPLDATPVVTAVVEGSPAQGNLQAGEQVVSVDGEPVVEPAQVAEAVRGRPIGSTLEIEVLREGESATVQVVSAPNPDDPSIAYIGISVGALYSAADFDIEFTLSDVGGPSAGLMFSLAIVDKLTPESLTGGGFVAGTGSIDPAGQVGAIGGIRQKLAGARNAGATLFLMPSVHCAEAQGFIPEGLSVAPVSTLDEAVAALASWRSGEPIPACPAE